ncbi:MAG: hypothetical protein R2734_11045 [Nocardioides sp.]
MPRSSASLVAVEIASGILQGFTPIWKDIAGHLSMRDADVQLVRGRAADRVRAVDHFSPGSGIWSGTRGCCSSRPR